MAIRLRGLAVVGALLVLVAATNILAAPPTGGTGPGGLYSTDGTSNLVLWLRADKGVSLGGGTEVMTWADQSGYGHNASGSVGSTPDLVTGASGINGMPALNFVNANDEYLSGYLNPPSPGTDLDDVTLTTVVQLELGSRSTIFAMGSSSPPHYPDGYDYFGFGLKDEGSGAYWHHDSRNNGSWAGYMDVRGGNFTPDTDPHMTAWTDYASTGARTLHVDGSLASNDGGQDRYNNPGQVSTYSVGSATDLWEYGGLISEVILHKSALNGAERVILDNVLSSKYGINMLAGDHYSEGTGDYRLDVFGLGQSGSDSVTSAGAGGMGFEITSTLADGDWAFAGHNTTTNGVTTFALGERWERVWFIDFSGEDVDGTLAFDLNSAAFTDPEAGEYRLLYSGSDPYSWDVAPYVATVDGNTVSFSVSTTDLPTEDGYFTLGVVPESGSLLLLLSAGAMLLLGRRKGGTR